MRHDVGEGSAAMGSPPASTTSVSALADGPLTEQLLDAAAALGYELSSVA